jgi:hypothetical protein
MKTTAKLPPINLTRFAERAGEVSNDQSSAWWSRFRTKDQAGNNVPIWDGFSFRANGQRSYSPVRRAGKIVARMICFSASKEVIEALQAWTRLLPLSRTGPSYRAVGSRPFRSKSSRRAIDHGSLKAEVIFGLFLKCFRAIYTKALKSCRSYGLLQL